MSPPLAIRTTSGPVLGFADTFLVGETSKGEDIVKDGVDGGQRPVYKWLGIPYAQAARWKRPSPPEAWTDPKPCYEFGTKFWQPPSGIEKLFAHQPGVFTRHFLESSENSHTVNVFAPDGSKAGDDLAVLVWIYGGSLNNGSADRFIYDPTEWIRAQTAKGQKFLVISGNYRTNAFGFLSTPDLLAEDPDGLVGNYGLYDVVSLLEWVQANIKAFGGSPDRVTIFGESAGGFIVSNLLVSGRKLFKQAIMQSGVADTMLIRPHSQSYPSHSFLLPSETSYATPETRLAALRAIPAEHLLELHNTHYKFGGLSLTIEEGPKATWTESTMDKVRRGEWDPWIEGVIVGTNEHEGSVFAMNLGVWDGEGLAKFIDATYPPAVRPRLHELYSTSATLPSTPSYPDSPGSRLISDSLFVTPAYNLCKAIASQKHKKAGTECKVWKYRCRAEVGRITRTHVELGSMHCIEIPLVFHTLSLFEPGSGELEVSEAFSDRWATFAISGNPDNKWVPFTPSAPSWLAFAQDGSTKNESLADFEKDNLDFSGKNWGMHLEDLNE